MGNHFQHSALLKSGGVFLLGCLCFIFVSCQSSKNGKSTKRTKNASTQTPVWLPDPAPYRPSATRVFDLIHTKLEVSFLPQKRHLLGMAELTLKPYFYPQNTLVLDAKGMSIEKVMLIQPVGTLVIAEHTEEKLTLTLPRYFQKDEEIIISIQYTAKPEERKSTSGQAIHSDQGLYFINPDGKDEGKPFQIWTQGEPQSASCWFPTLDQPNEKCTQEVFITVDEGLQTLSNGEFMYSKKNGNGTKTDYWKQSKPHAPYLFMMVVGKYAVIKDQWRDKEVSYYVEPEYEKHARAIFGRTPEMMEFFSKKMGYAFPWDKYASVVVRDYVSGAMENTSATVFMEQLQKTDRELIDQHWDDIISHELFHHWFGDLVTCESWANLALNESFATYGEYLWYEHKYGKDAAEAHRLDDLEQYLRESDTKQVPIIRYRHGQPDDMFDSHSYAKGGLVLHMLRQLVGDAAFFESLKRYLKKHEYQNVEIHDLRLAFEEVTGKDLNPFFNQWFLSSGHPQLVVSDTVFNQKLYVEIKQVQDSTYTPIYSLPLKIGIWTKGKWQIENVVVDKARQLFTFDVDSIPSLVLVDYDQTLLGTIKHPKKGEEWVLQYQKRPESFGARLSALKELQNYLKGPKVAELMVAALKDPSPDIREEVLDIMSDYKGASKEAYHQELLRLAKTDKRSKVRALAIEQVSKKKDSTYLPMYIQAMQDSSFKVVSAGLSAYLKSGSRDIESKVKPFENSKMSDVVVALSEYYADSAKISKNAWFLERMKTLKGEDLYLLIRNYGKLSLSLKEEEQKQAISKLQDLALNHSNQWIRLGAYQALGDLKKIEGVSAIRKTIKDAEKSDRLKKIYSYID